MRVAGVGGVVEIQSDAGKLSLVRSLNAAGR